MNAEIYFPRNGKAFGRTSEKSFEDTIKKLNSMNVNIIYKTEINLTEESIREALKVTETGDDKIGLIFIADALTADDEQQAKALFESFGVIGKIRRTQGECIDPMTETEESIAEKEKKAKKAKKDKEQKLLAGDTGVIDISGGLVDIEQKHFYAYSAEYNNKLIVLLPSHELLDSDFNTVLYTAARSVASPKKKRSFWKRFIPCKGDRPADVIRKVILILAICTFVVSSCMLINILFVEPAMNDRTAESIRQLLVSTDETGESEPPKKADGSEGVLSDFAKLIEANPDTVGWITVPNTKVDYVVMQSPGDAKRVANGEDPYYLYRDFYGNDTKYGSIFLDYRSSLDGKNMILHGHHMRDGRMFANLTDFDQLEVYRNTPVFTYNTIYEKSKWKIISIFKTNTLKWQGEIFNYLRGSFSSDYDFLNFVYELEMRSIIDCPVSVNENDTIVTLSTCTYDYEDFRFVVVARKVRDGEDATVDVSKAKYNDDTLYPDIWYEYRGGTKPVMTSFQDAYNKGLAPWYDGKGKWSAKDDEELTRLLNEGKDNAEKMLRSSYNKNDYAKAQQDEIESIIRKYMTQINEASKASEVNDLYAQALAEISEIKTKSQVQKEQEESKKASDTAHKEASEQALRDGRSSAIEEIRRSIEGNEYRVPQYDQIQELIERYTQQINNAKTAAEIDKIKKTAIDALKKIKTNEQLNSEEESKEESSRQAAEESSRRASEESAREASRQAAEESSRRASEESAREASRQELESYRSRAITELNYYPDRDDYDTDHWSSILGIIVSYTNRINSAGSIDAIRTLVGMAEKQMDKVDTKPYQTSSQSSVQPSVQPSAPQPSKPEPVSSEPEPVSSEPSEDESSGEETSVDNSDDPDISQDSLTET